MLFTTADDVHESLGRLLQELATDAEIAPRLIGLDTVVQLRCRKPDTKLTLVAKAADAPTVSFGELAEGAAAPEIVLTMDADVAHALWLGKQNVAIGIARGAIQAKGESSKIVDLLRLTGDVAPRYAQLLRSAGREDLADAELVEQPVQRASDAEQAAASPDADGDASPAADEGASPDADEGASPDADEGASPDAEQVAASSDAD